MLEADIWDRLKLGQPNECWPFLGSVDSRGYGNLRIGGKTARAHRVAYEVARGSIPKGSGHHGVVVMHTCDNRLCCNPNHLRLGTQADNVADMVAKGRKPARTGVRNGRAVLTPTQVQTIRRDARSIRAIAADYLVSRAAVQRIRSGKAWSCLAS